MINLDLYTQVYVVRTKRKRSKTTWSYGPYDSDRADKIAAHERLKDPKMIVWIETHLVKKPEVPIDIVADVMRVIKERWMR